MLDYFRIPLIFFVVSGGIGLLLRWHFVQPMEWINYPYWLHAHSHMMFLGWVSNALYLGFINSFVPEKWRPRYRWLFIGIQVLLAGMLVSFPLQGYGLFSILFATVHTLLLALFCFWYFSDVRAKAPSVALWYSKISLVFFLISALGPFAIAATSAAGLGQSNWYYFSVYYYLHFQYNGFFSFGVLALFFRILEQKGIPFSQEDARVAGWFLALACVPAYFLSTLWADPGTLFNAAGFVAGFLQVIFLLFIIRLLKTAFAAISLHFSTSSVRTLLVATGALTIKILLQLLSAHEGIARMAYMNRSYVMAYLHLVLIGFVSLLLIVWYMETFLLKRLSTPAIILLVGGLAGMEIALVLAPSWSQSGIGNVADPQVTLFFFPVVLWSGILLLLLSFRKPDKTPGDL